MVRSHTSLNMDPRMLGNGGVGQTVKPVCVSNTQPIISVAFSAEQQCGTGGFLGVAIDKSQILQQLYFLVYAPCYVV